MVKYWENEMPVEIYTGKNLLKYYKQAGKLQISNDYWKNEAGEQKQGKTSTLDIAAIKDNPDALSLIQGIFGVME